MCPLRRKHGHEPIGTRLNGEAQIGRRTPAGRRQLRAARECGELGVSQNDSVPETAQLRSGFLFHGRYQVVRCIGNGGMGAVYEVVQVETRRRRALKTLLPSLLSDPEARARFHLEATVAAEVDSDHIVEVLDAGVDAATALPFLVMELLRGENLAEVLRRRGRLSPAESCLLLKQVAGALDRTHRAAVIHRDLKPENLFLTQRDDGTPHIKLLDFGVAKIVAQSSLANTTRSLGTPLYMSPEQIRGAGDIGPAADLYSLGQIAFTLLTGTAYFEPESRVGGGVYALLLKILDGAPERASQRSARLGVELPLAFDAWFSRACSLQPGDRFGTAMEQIDELERALDLPAQLASAPVSLSSGALAVASRSSGPVLSGPASASRVPVSATGDGVILGKPRGVAAELPAAAGASDSVIPPFRRRSWLPWMGVTGVALAGGVGWLVLNPIFAPFGSTHSRGVPAPAALQSGTPRVETSSPQVNALAAVEPVPDLKIEPVDAEPTARAAATATPSRPVKPIAPTSRDIPATNGRGAGPKRLNPSPTRGVRRPEPASSRAPDPTDER